MSELRMDAKEIAKNILVDLGEHEEYRYLSQAYLEQSKELANYIAGERVELTAIENLGDQILITEALENELAEAKGLVNMMADTSAGWMKRAEAAEKELAALIEQVENMFWV